MSTGVKIINGDNRPTPLVQFFMSDPIYIVLLGLGASVAQTVAEIDVRTGVPKTIQSSTHTLSRAFLNVRYAYLVVTLTKDRIISK